MTVEEEEEHWADDPQLWYQRDGTPIQPEHMTTKHIELSIARINRHKARGKPWRSRWLDVLAMELLRRTANEEEK